MDDASDRFLPGTRFGRFTIVASLGAGGMGRVFSADDPTLRRRVAIKVLGDQAGADARDLLAEARAASGLNHPNICTIYEVGDVEGTPFIAMEIVDGQPLSSLIVAGGLPNASVVGLGLQIASALAHAHDRRVVHGDLKSQNVMVTSSGNVKLLDFGLARTLDPVSLDSVTRTAANHTVAGTLPYMAPETLKGARLTAASDVWSFGVLLQEMATGARPFQGKTGFDLAASIMNATPAPLPPTLSSACAAVIGRCLQLDPSRRYATGQGIVLAMEPLVSGATAATTGVASSRTPQKIVMVLVIVALTAGGACLWRTWRSPPAATARAPMRSIMVLPFDNLSGDSADDYFAAGMTDALITDLSRIPGLRVISRTSSVRYKADGKTSQDIARDLDVDGIVDGSVLHAQDDVRISVRLVDAAHDRNMWGQDYTRKLEGVLRLQADVARAVAGEIRASFLPADQARFASAGPVNPQVLEEYLKGRYQWNRRTSAALLQSIEHYQKALSMQPDYAPALAGLAQSLVILPAFPVSTMSPLEALPKAREAAERALKLDDRLGDAHAALAYERLFAYDLTAADASFQRALSVSPGDAVAHFWYAAALAVRGRTEESLDQVHQAQALDPVSPIVLSGVSWMHHLARQFDKEVEMAKAALALEPNFMMARYRLGEGLLHLGQIEAALPEFQKAVELSTNNPDAIAALAYATGRAGHQRQTADLLRRLVALQSDRSRYVSPLAMALAYTGAGDRDRAFRWLSRAIDDGGWAVFVSVDPDWDSLRSDPRFQSLVRQRIGAGRH